MLDCRLFNGQRRHNARQCNVLKQAGPKGPERELQKFSDARPGEKTCLMVSTCPLPLWLSAHRERKTLHGLRRPSSLP